MVWACRVAPANWIWMTEAGARGWAGPRVGAGREDISYSAPLTGWGRHRAQPHLFCYIWYQAPASLASQHTARALPTGSPRTPGTMASGSGSPGPGTLSVTIRIQEPISSPTAGEDTEAGLVLGVSVCVSVAPTLCPWLAVAVHLCRGQSEEAPAGEHSLMSPAFGPG